VGSTAGDEEDRTLVEEVPEPPTPTRAVPAVLSSSHASFDVEGELLTGAEVGEYRVEAKIGEGAMGVVYAAVHPLIGKHVAVKVLKQSLCHDRGAVERFLDEARVVNAIGNPHIVDVFAFGALPDGRRYLVMEWLRGESLRDRIAEGGLPIDEVCDIIIPLTRALEAAHASGVIHRDLKPDNVFLVEVAGEPPKIKLLDFGIAKLIKEDHHVHRTIAGAMVGTPQYVSPEQARGYGIDHRADIYSLGVVVYELLTGKPPFIADNAAEMVAKHLIEPAPEPSLLRGEVPQVLDELVLGMLNKHPSGRPSLPDVRAVLERLRGELATTPMRPLRIRKVRISEAVTTPIPPDVVASAIARVDANASATTSASAHAALPLPPPPASQENHASDSASMTMIQRRRTAKDYAVRAIAAVIALAGVALIVRAVLRSAPAESTAPIDAALPMMTVTPIAEAGVAPPANPEPAPEPAPVVAASPPPEPAGHVHIELAGAPAARFTLDHRSLGELPALDADVAPGRHELEIRADGFTTQHIALTVGPETTTRRTIAMHHPAPTSSTTRTPQPEATDPDRMMQPDLQGSGSR